MTDRQRDRLLAVLAAAFATLYVSAARSIEDSLLSDAVGAGGVPQAVGIALVLAALALFAKSFVGPAAAAESKPAQPSSRLGAALRTVGLALILLTYAALLPLLGYPLSVSLLVLAAGWLAGAALKAPLLLSAALSGPLLWALFDQLLQVRMPVGSLWG